MSIEKYIASNKSATPIKKHGITLVALDNGFSIAWPTKEPASKVAERAGSILPDTQDPRAKAGDDQATIFRKDGSKLNVLASSATRILIESERAEDVQDPVAIPITKAKIKSGDTTVEWREGTDADTNTIVVSGRYFQRSRIIKLAEHTMHIAQQPYNGNDAPEPIAAFLEHVDEQLNPQTEQ